MGVKGTETRQVSARLKSRTHDRLKKRLKEDDISMQEFFESTVQAYIDKKMQIRKHVHVIMHPSDELHLQLESGDGYEADDVGDLMDQLEGRKKFKRIKK